MRSGTGGLLVTVALCMGATGWAGSKVVLPVSVSTGSSTGSATGSLGSARNSADSVQFIGCVVTTLETGSPSVLCSAKSASGTYGACTTTNAALVAAARSLTPDGNLRFYWNTSTGKCTEIVVDVYSDTEPK